MLAASVTIRSFRKQFDAKLRKHLGGNLDTAAKVLRDDIRHDISIDGHGVSSKPGDPPHRQTGDLWQSYFYATDFNDLVARVGSPLDYSLKLELGDLTVAPRPHVRRNLYGNIRMRRALCRPL